MGGKALKAMRCKNRHVREAEILNQDEAFDDDDGEDEGEDTNEGGDWVSARVYIAL